MILILIKFVFTFPYLLWLIIRSWVISRKIKKKYFSIPESKRYRWIKRQTTYLCWLFNIKIKIHGLKNWKKRKSCILFTSQLSFFIPLILFRIINFKKYSPLSLVFVNEEFSRKWLVRNFWSIVNIIYFDSNFSLQAVKKRNIDLLWTWSRIRRSIVIMGISTFHQLKKNEHLFEVAYSANLKIIPLRVVGIENILKNNLNPFRLFSTEVSIFFEEKLTPFFPKNKFFNLLGSNFSKK